MTHIMQLPIKGRCLCEAICYDVNELPKRTGLCYCRSCQIKSGSGHLAYLAFSIDAVNLTGPVKWYQSIGDSGELKQHGFCPECGTILFGKPTFWPQILAIYAGSLDIPSEYNPEINLWVQDAQSWDHVNDELKIFEKNPG